MLSAQWVCSKLRKLMGKAIGKQAMTSEWVEFLEQVSQLTEERLKEGKSLWFRGQRYSGWKLLPGLHRKVEEFLKKAGREDTEEQKVALLSAEYQSLYQNFRNKAISILGPDERDRWSIVFTMQHHRIPTRLLDWTESFLCALYFCFEKWKPADEAVIFALCPEELNKTTYNLDNLFAFPPEGQAGLTDLEVYLPDSIGKPGPTCAVVPPFSNPRMVAQQSVFTLSGDSFIPLEQELEGTEVLRKFVLPPSLYQDAGRFLDLLGTGPFTYLPDLEGLSKEVTARDKKRDRIIGEYYK